MVKSLRGTSNSWQKMNSKNAWPGGEGGTPPFWQQSAVMFGGNTALSKVNPWGWSSCRWI